MNYYNNHLNLMQNSLGMNHQVKTVSNEQLIRVLQNCQNNCYQMIMKVFNKPDHQLRVRQNALLAACAEVCLSTTIVLSFVSEFSKDSVELCSKVCQACGRECAQFTDYESLNCASVCLHCAEECNQFLSTRL